MPDITTTEGREELRRLIPPHGSKDIQAWAHPALDGLDIAEEMAEALIEATFADPDGCECNLCKLSRRWQDWKQGMAPAEEER